MNSSPEKPITLTISQRSELEHRLDAAVAELLGPAKRLSQGVLVTRHSPASFTVRLSEEVPYGTTQEIVSW